MKKEIDKYIKSTKFNGAINACIAIAFAFFLYKIGDVCRFFIGIMKLLTPLWLGIFFAHILFPIKDKIQAVLPLKKEKVSRGISLFVAVFLFVGAIATFAFAIFPSVVSNATAFLDKVDHINVSGLPRFLRDALSKVSLKDELPNLVFVNINQILSASQSVLNIFFNFGVGFIIAIYFVIEQDSIYKFVSFAYKKVTKKDFEIPFAIVKKCSALFSRYLLCTLADAFIVAVINMLFMSVTKTQSVSLVSIIVGVFNVIPTFGPLVGAGLGFFILVVQSPKVAIRWIIFTIVLQTVDGCIIKPRFFGGAMGISPLLTLLAIILGGKMFGAWGMLLSIPFIAMVSVIKTEAIEIKKAKDAAEERLVLDMLVELETISLKSPWKLSLGVNSDVPQTIGFYPEKNRFFVFENFEGTGRELSYTSSKKEALELVKALAQKYPKISTKE